MERASYAATAAVVPSYQGMHMPAICAEALSSLSMSYML